MATIKPDHTAQRAAAAAAAAQRAATHNAAIAQAQANKAAHNAAIQSQHDAVAAAKLARQQGAATAKSNAVAAKQAAALAKINAKAALTAAKYAAKHPELNYNGQAPVSITNSTTPSGGATTGSDITPLAPGQTLQDGSGAGVIDSSQTTQPTGPAATKPEQTFIQKHKTAVIVVGVVGGIVFVVGLYGYAKYRAFTYPFRKAAKIIGVTKSAGRAIGSAVRS